MIVGDFTPKGELVFDLDLVAADNTLIYVEALFDTGFTEWLLINDRDAIALGWKRNTKPIAVQTAGGQTVFNLYRGLVILDGEEFTIPVLGGDKTTDILLGVKWLRYKRLVADLAARVLTLE